MTRHPDRMYHPECVVEDAAELLDLSPADQRTLRKILRDRGINKALAIRRRFIAIKHEAKDLVRAGAAPTRKEFQELYTKMQHTAKMPRTVVWGRRTRDKDDYIVEERRKRCRQ